MAKSPSTKKVARAAAAGGGRVSRPGERNLFFPVAMAAVVIIGVVFIAIARNERISNADNSPPRVNRDHFHSAYRIDICGESIQLPNDSVDDRTGIHTHGDGLIHIHPFVSTVSGRNATIGAFLEESDGLLADDRLELPGRTVVEGVDTCDGEPGELRVLKWVSVSADDPIVFEADLADVRLDQANAGQGQLFTIAFAAESTETEDIARPDDAFLRQYLGLPPEDQPLGETDTGDPLTPSTTAPATDTTTTDGG